MANKSWFGALLGGAVGMLGGCAGGDESRGDDTFAPGTTSSDVPSDSSSDDGGGLCIPGMQSACACPGGVDGVQVCRDDGSGYEACECGGAVDDGPTDDTGDGATTGDPEPCGNGTCDADEDCTTCEMDCGACEPCTAAPSCDGAQIPPVIDTHADFLDDPMAYKPPLEIMGDLVAHVDAADPAARLVAAALSEPRAGEPVLVAKLREAFAAHPTATAAVRRQLAAAGMPDPAAYVAVHPVPSVAELAALWGTAAQASGGATSIVDPVDPLAAPCDDPRMRIRVARLDVHEEDDDLLNDEVYCVITAEAAEASELKITPITPSLDEGDSYTYNLEAGLVWGQADLAAPKGNLLLAYSCIESDTSNGYSNLLMAVGDAATAAGGVDIPGVDGWVFPAVGIVANLLAGALTLDGDDLLFNGTQVVPETEMINLTHGAWWSVRRNGTNVTSDWDWELRMEIWGCHDNGTG